VRKLKKTDRDIFELLEMKVREFNTPAFITDDPIAIPHRYTDKRDREIAGFLAATIAWGQRPTIVRNGHRLMELLHDAPYEFIMSTGTRELKSLKTFVHRTFNSDDLIVFIQGFRRIYNEHATLEDAFYKHHSTGNILDTISSFRMEFLGKALQERTAKHVSDPGKGSSAKRINMFLRWMIRRDKTGVDFGIWQQFSPSELMCPLDVHVGNVARSLQLLERKIDDRKAVEELTANLRLLDPKDPVKYDFALFGLGIFEGWKSITT
jgi:uncharacterized protein (TIGR02757 family)